MPLREHPETGRVYLPDAIHDCADMMRECIDDGQECGRNAKNSTELAEKLHWRTYERYYLACCRRIDDYVTFVLGSDARSEFLPTVREHNRWMVRILYAARNEVGIPHPSRR